LKFIRYLWAFPNTLIGLSFSTLALVSGGHAAFKCGILEVHGGICGWILRYCAPIPGGAQAITFGHIVIARNASMLDLTRAHERVHVRQYERWGPFFLPAYSIVSLSLLLSGQDSYRQNYFEQEAFRQE
jgi:hypothetical protein